MARNAGQGDWVSSQDAAVILSVSPKTISRWEAEGRLKTYGIRVHRTLGGHRRFQESGLLALRDRLTEVPHGDL